MTWEEIQTYMRSGWILGPIVLAGWIIVLFLVKSVVFKKFRIIAERSKTKIDDILINVLNLPLNLMIVFVGLLIMQRIMPMTDVQDQYLGYAFKLILILVGIFFVDQLVKGILDVYGEKSDFRHLRQGAIQGVVRGLIFITGAIILLDSFGVNISPLVASLGITSLAIALALQPTLSNLFSGLSISMDKSISVGDLVELENGERGYIEDIGWRASKVRLRSNNLIIIPNSTLVNSVVKNFEVPESQMRVYIRCGVSYGSDLDHVENIAMEVTHEVERDLDEADETFESWFRYELFAESSINFCIIMQAMNYRANLTVTHEMIKRLHKRFREEGIIIPFPLRTLDIQPQHEALLRDISGKLAG